MRANTLRPSRRAFVSGAAALSAHIWIPKPVKGYTAAEMRAMSIEDGEARRLEMGARHAGALRRSRQDGAEHRDDAGDAEGERRRQPAARQDAQVRRDRQAASWPPARSAICCAKLSEAEAMFAQGVDKILMTTANPSTNKIRRAMALRKANPELHPGGRLRAERARSERRRQGSRRRRRRRDRRRCRHAQRHSGRQTRCALAQAHRQAPEPEAARHASYDGGVQHVKGFANAEGAHAEDASSRTSRPTRR